MHFQDRYRYDVKKDLLGSGGFATVYKATDSLLNRTVALKFFTNIGGEKHTLVREISNAIKFEHPNLCRFYDVQLLQNANIHGQMETIEVGVMEFLDGGDISSYLRKYPQYLSQFLTDVLHGLAYIHKRGVIHRDLKSQNILIKTGAEGPIAKITDFGISKSVDSEHTSTSALIGSVAYMAPEQFEPQKYGLNGRLGTPVDFWSFGVLTYELVTGKSLFGRHKQISTAEIIRNIFNDTELPEKLKDLPQPYKQIATRCLVKRSADRVQTADELIDILNAHNVAESLPAPPASGEPAATTARTTVLTAPGKPASPQKKNSRIMFIVPAVAVLVAVPAWLYFHSGPNANGQHTTFADNTKVVDSPSNSSTLAGSPPSVKASQSAILPTIVPHAVGVRAADSAKKIPVVADSVYNLTKADNVGDLSYQRGANGLYGFANKAGKFIIQPAYREVLPFGEDRAAVRKDEKWGFIDHTGKLVIPYQFDNVSPLPFQEGVTPVVNDNLYGVIDRSGKIIIPFQYDLVWSCENGLLRAKRNNGAHGVIDKNNNPVIPFVYEDISSLFQSKAFTAKKSGKWGVIDTTGNIVTPFKYDKVWKVSSEDGKVLLANNKGDTVAFDRHGNLLPGKKS